MSRKDKEAKSNDGRTRIFTKRKEVAKCIDGKLKCWGRSRCIGEIVTSHGANWKTLYVSPCVPIEVVEHIVDYYAGPGTSAQYSRR